MIEIVERLKKAREKYCLTLFDVSLQTGIRERVLWSWERNNHKPQKVHIEKITKFLIELEKEKKMEEKKQIQSLKIPLVELINNGEYEFIAMPKKPGKYQPDIERNGVLWHSIYTKKLVSGLEQSEEIIIGALEMLACEGRIKIHGLSIAPTPADSDIRVRCEIGCGQRDLLNSQITTTRLYKDVPLDQEELKSKEIILNLGEQILDMRKRKFEHFQAIYGVISDGSAIERQLRLEDEEDKRKFEDAIIKGKSGK